MASKYGLFTKDYRQSTNIEDKRDGRGEIRARMDTFGRGGGDNTNWTEFYRPDGRGKTQTRNSQTTPSTGGDTTQDDYGGGAADIGLSSGGITPDRKPSQARKVDAAEAVDTTYNRK